jgi:hypothetical protein
MAPRPHWRRAGQVVAGVASVALAMVAFAAVASAHSARPASISATVTSMSVQVSGSWTWTAEPKDPVPSYVGYAISWGDVTSGNDVGSYHVGDGTAATNVVFQPTVPDQGGSGTWGPDSHTYAASGTYMVCVIMYDLGEVKPFPATGNESLIAGGPNRNKDNSVDNGYDPAVRCATVQVTSPTATPTMAPSATPTMAPSATPTMAPTATPTVAPTPTPFESFAGETSGPGPTSTPPPTSTQLPSSGSTGGGPALPLMLLALASVLGAVALRPLRASRRG